MANERLYKIVRSTLTKDKTFTLRGGEKVVVEFKEQRNGSFVAENIPWAVAKKYKDLDTWVVEEMPRTSVVSEQPKAKIGKK